ncbi:DUF6343 family protein [Actinospica sp.]|uniref:DUF6343 family protein n=1 Tax=Actinospica sp. TaxID=1872142 RepID=UPI002B95E159|nr:DUF6343 family protein [Actinospica sp.]HWG27224.1 DUF6343 family protein [Actinospica sp.]
MTALIAVVDIVVVVRHIRAGPVFLPGPEVPPFRPAREPRPLPAPRPAARPAVRHVRYLLAVGVAVVLPANAWTWVRGASLIASVVISVLAALLITGGVIAANIESPIERDEELPPDPGAGLPLARRRARRGGCPPGSHRFTTAGRAEVAALGPAACTTGARRDPLSAAWRVAEGVNEVRRTG